MLKAARTRIHDLGQDFLRAALADADDNMDNPFQRARSLEIASPRRQA